LTGREDSGRAATALESAGGSDGSVRVVNNDRALQGEVDDEVGRRVGPVAIEEIFDEDAPSQVVVALLFAAPVRIVDHVEGFHDQ
jgi:hypothetical protein